MRKRNRIFKHRVTGVIYGSKKEEKMIQRYSKCGNRWTNSQTMISLPHGEYVLYTDHEQAMKEKDKYNRKLLNENIVYSNRINALKAELKTAKLDSARLIVQEEMYENLKCCANCSHTNDGFECAFELPMTRWSNRCDKWRSDQLTRDQRMKK